MIVRSLNVKDYYGVVCDDFYERLEDFIDSSWDSEKCTGRNCRYEQYVQRYPGESGGIFDRTDLPADTGKLRTKLKENVENYASPERLSWGSTQAY